MSLLKYNYALIPNNPQQFIDFSASRAKDEKSIGHYQIHQNAIPHVTICHFEALDNQLEILWDELINYNYRNFFLLHFSILHTGFHDGKYWHLLIPDEIHPLKKIYLNSVRVLNSYSHISSKKYFPHLTLFDSSYIDREDAEYILPTSLTDHFMLAIIDRDVVGQSKNILIK